MRMNFFEAAGAPKELEGVVSEMILFGSAESWQQAANAVVNIFRLFESKGRRKMDNEILEKVGEPAALEQLAEECGELAMAALKLGHAAQKLARIERKENPTPKTFEECREEFYEEVADVEVGVDVMMASPWAQVERINHYYDEHMKRWRKRLGIGEDSDKTE